jgi:hypothetical protein
MSHSIRLKQAAALGGVLLATTVLVACGGGGDGASPMAPDTVPPSAGTSTQSFVTFLQGLDKSDSAEPMELAGFLPPIDDTAEPFPLG